MIGRIFLAREVMRINPFLYNSFADISIKIPLTDWDILSGDFQDQHLHLKKQTLSIRRRQCQANRQRTGYH
jgi:hypothetical protein